MLPKELSWSADSVKTSSVPAVAVLATSTLYLTVAHSDALSRDLVTFTAGVASESVAVAVSPTGAVGLSALVLAMDVREAPPESFPLAVTWSVKDPSVPVKLPEKVQVRLSPGFESVVGTVHDTLLALPWVPAAQAANVPSVAMVPNLVSQTWWIVTGPKFALLNTRAL
jgi:hypothetical protein